MAAGELGDDMRQNNTLPPIRSVLKPRDTHFLPSRELPTPRLHTQNTVRALKHTFPACHTFALDRVHRGRPVIAIASTPTDEQKNILQV